MPIKHDISVMFSDLSEEKQNEVLMVYNINSPEEMNWDVIPITMIPIPEETLKGGIE